MCESGLGVVIRILAYCFNHSRINIRPKNWAVFVTEISTSVPNLRPDGLDVIADIDHVGCQSDQPLNVHASESWIYSIYLLPQSSPCTCPLRMPPKGIQG